jgi:hypothetical protein
MVRGSNTAGAVKSTPKRLSRLWSPPILLSSGYRGCFRNLKRPGRKADHLHPVLKVRISGAVRLRPLVCVCVCLWRAQNLLCINFSCLCIKLKLNAVFMLVLKTCRFLKHVACSCAVCRHSFTIFCSIG